VEYIFTITDGHGAVQAFFRLGPQDTRQHGRDYRKTVGPNQISRDPEGDPDVDIEHISPEGKGFHDRQKDDRSRQDVPRGVRKDRKIRGKIGSVQKHQNIGEIQGQDEGLVDSFLYPFPEIDPFPLVTNLDHRIFYFRMSRKMAEWLNPLPFRVRMIPDHREEKTEIPPRRMKVNHG
jgi:hypothetical protein